MRLEITGEAPFQVLAHHFAVSPSAEGYTVNYSADGINYTADSEAVVPAGENLEYLGCAWGTYIKLSGNASAVVIQF